MAKAFLSSIRLISLSPSTSLNSKNYIAVTFNFSKASENFINKSSLSILSILTYFLNADKSSSSVAVDNSHSY